MIASGVAAVRLANQRALTLEGLGTMLSRSASRETPMNIAVKPETAKADAVAEAWATPLAELNPARVDRFPSDTIWPVFERLRREDPVHFTPQSEYGPYWSINRWDDIMAVDTNHIDFSSADGITLVNQVQMAEQDKIFEQM